MYIFSQFTIGAAYHRSDGLGTAHHDPLHHRLSTVSKFVRHIASLQTKRSEHKPAPFKSNTEPALLGFFGVALLEAFYASGRVNHALAARVEGVAGAAKLDLEHLARGAGGEGVAAGAGYLRVGVILGMNLFFHRLALSVNADLSAILAGGLELDRAVDGGIEGMVAPYAYVIAGFDVRTHLAYQYGAGSYGFATEALDAKHLGLAVATVAG